MRYLEVRSNLFESYKFHMSILKKKTFHSHRSMSGVIYSDMVNKKLVILFVSGDDRGERETFN